MGNFFLKQKICFYMTLLTVAIPIFANADTLNEKNNTTFTLTNPLRVNSVADLFQNFVDIFSYVVIIVAVMLLIWVGLQFILARGDSKKMGELKEWLFWIVVGVAIVIGARLIVQVVVNTLASTGTVDTRTIQSVQNVVGGK